MGEVGVMVRPETWVVEPWDCGQGVTFQKGPRECHKRCTAITWCHSHLTYYWEILPMNGNESPQPRTLNIASVRTKLQVLNVTLHFYRHLHALEDAIVWQTGAFCVFTLSLWSPAPWRPDTRASRRRHPQKLHPCPRGSSASRALRGGGKAQSADSGLLDITAPWSRPTVQPGPRSSEATLWKPRDITPMTKLLVGLSS